MADPSPAVPGTDSADPYRKRREIDEMERRFRERAERAPGGPPTGEIDQRVQDEMKQFFADSAERAARVVSTIDEQPGSGLSETTGEIRRKIDDFFSQVKDAPGGVGAPQTQEIVLGRPAGVSPNSTQEITLAPGRGAHRHGPPSEPIHRASVLGALAAQTPAVAGAQLVQAPQARPASAATVHAPTRPSSQKAPPPAAPQRPVAEPAAAQAAHAPGAPAASAAADAPAQKMDLKTALERLRRHGVVRGDAPRVSAVAPRPAAKSAGAAPASAPAASAAPARPAPAPAAAAAPAPRPTPAAPSASAVPAGSSKGASPPPSAAPANRGAAPAAAAAPSPAVPERRPPAGLSAGAASVVAAPAGARGASAPANAASAPQDAAPGNVPPTLEPLSDAPPSPAAAPSAAAARSPSPAVPGFVPPRREPTVRGLPPIREDEPKSGPLTGMPVLPPKRREATRQNLPSLQAVAALMGMSEPPVLRPAPEVPATPPQRPNARAESGAQAPAPRAPAPGFESVELPPESAASEPPMVLPATPPKPRRAEADAEPASPQDARARAAAGLEAASERHTPPSPADANPQRALRREPVAPPSDGTGPVARDLGSGSSVGRTSETTGTLRDGGKSFDSIFDELQGLVLETLQSSVEESLASASTSEKELSETTGRALVPSEPVGSRESSATDGAGAKSAAAGAKFAKPDDDDDEAGEAAAEASAAPAAPYDWGVKKAARPPGAWLVENEEKPEEPAAKKTGPETAPEPKPVPGPAEGGPAAAGGRSYLVKKLGDEVRKIQPAVEALQAKGIVSAKDLGAAADSGKPAPEKTDDMVSVDDVADRAPVDLEKELSPARLVDELRRLRRLTDALMAKGVLSESDLQKRAEDA